MEGAETEHNLISQALKATLEPEQKTKDSESYIVLEDLAKEFKDDNTPLLFSRDNLDSVLWSIFNNKFNSPAKAFNYIYSTYKRILDKQKHLRRSKDKETEIGILGDLIPVLLNYALLTVTDPSVFEENATDVVKLANIMTSLKETDRQFWDFFDLLTKQAEESDSLVDFLGLIIPYLNKGILKNQLEPMQTRKYLDVYSHFVLKPSIALALTKLPTFNPPDMSAVSVEKDTVLGPLLSISPIHPSLSITTFPEVSTLSKGRIHQTYSAIRAEFQIIQTQLFAICDKIIRSSPEARKNLLAFFGKIIDLNHKRMAMRVDSTIISSDGLMLNILSLLLKFSEPFIDIQGSRINRIVVNYFKTAPVYDISEETMIHGDRNEAEEFYKTKDPDTPNFVSDIFFLTLAYLQYGLHGSIHTNKQTKVKLDEFNNQQKYLEDQMSRYPPDSLNARTFKFALEKMLKERDLLMGYYHLVRALLVDSEFEKRILSFNIFASSFFVRLVQPSHSYPYPDKTIDLPFNQAEPPKVFSFYPEYFVDNIAQHILYLGKELPELLIRNPQFDRLLVFLITFLFESKYINNPYVKIRFIEVVFLGSIELLQGIPGFFIDLFNTDQLCLKHLFHTLMKFYIDIERTGASSQFEDKFNARYHISQIIRTLWHNHIYRDRLKEESNEDPDFFVKFVALLLNDSTYLMDESLTKLAEIHRLQKEIEAIDNGTSEDSNDPNARLERERRLTALERMTTSYVLLANQSAILLDLFTVAVPKAFVTRELVDRLAAMLDFNLEALVGPRCGELAVKNADKYGWKPKEMLRLMVGVYLNLKDEEPFIHAVANDGRSFSPATFKRAVDILRRTGIRSPEEIAALEKFAQNAERAKTEDEAGEEELGEIPDEFLDPLMYTLMENPVILPSSKVRIDLSTIKSHLLSESNDPFNRAPLSIDQVVPDEELKKRIEEFKLSKRRPKDEKTNDKMDLES